MFKIIIEKYESNIDIEFEGDFSTAQLDIFFKDLCLYIIHSENEFDNISTKNGYAEIIFENNIDEILKNSYTDGLTLQQILNKLNLILESKDKYNTLYKERSYIDINKIENEITKILNSQYIYNLSDLLGHYKKDIEFYFKEIYPKIFSRTKIVFQQTGFTYHEFKLLLSSFYNDLSNRFTFLYKVNFIELTIKS